MADPFLSEIRLMSFAFPPKGWAFCNGQLLPINQNQALFSLLGTTYGGNGQTTFALPNLQGRAPLHSGSGYTLGQTGGEEGHTLTIGELPSHTHSTTAANTAASAASPAGAVSAEPVASVGAVYGPAGTPVSMASHAVGNTGGSQAHLNIQPSLVINFCIALQGIFPSQT